MSIHHLLLYCLFLTVLCIPAQVYAQTADDRYSLDPRNSPEFFREPTLELEHRRRIMEMDPAERSQRALEIYDSLPQEDKLGYLTEAERVYQYCEGRNPFSKFHDCQCIGARVFEEILLNPNPDIDAVAVGDRIAGDCPNIPGAAAFAYENCIGRIVTNMSYGQEAFCECYANEFAGFYETNTASNYSHFSNLGASAILTCDNKGLASPLNPLR
jgi:hypothetical protein